MFSIQYFSTFAKAEVSGWTKCEATQPILHDHFFDERLLREPARLDYNLSKDLESRLVLYKKAWFSESKKNFTAPIYDQNQTFNGSGTAGVTRNNTSGDLMSAPTTLNSEFA